MYEVDDRDEVVELAEVPQSDVGAPCPLLVATESRLQVAYMVQRQEMFADSSIAVVTFTAPYAHMFGPPNDEAFEGHPLAERGLEPYGAYQVANSSWIRRLERMNSVHDRHDAAVFERLTHYVLSFHDSTFECVAKNIEFSVRPPGEPVSLVATLSE